MTDRAEKFLAWRAAQKVKIARPYEFHRLDGGRAPISVDKYDHDHFVRAGLAAAGARNRGYATSRQGTPRVATPFMTSTPNTMTARQ